MQALRSTRPRPASFSQTFNYSKEPRGCTKKQDRGILIDRGPYVPEIRAMVSDIVRTVSPLGD